jgi:PII-like signaling protein
MGPYLACRFVFALPIVIEIVDSGERDSGTAAEV